MPSQGKSFTNHPGIIDFMGSSYFFYHNGALAGGSGYQRSVAVEKFNYNADGTIPTIQMTTAGPPQVGTLNPYAVAFGAGPKTFRARVASANSGGKVELRLGSNSGTLIGSCTVAGTGSWQTWTTVACPVNGATNTQDLLLRFTGNGSDNLFNFNWWQLNSASGSPPEVTTPGVPATTTRPLTTTSNPSPQCAQLYG
ncbi:uncharacterized protein PgNI_02672 [Pyricularia grisea]|uniref:CBM6 domain-containing protein n=1 Tax=Pyricularia grisea TaxID=148305 RepID=A0A6P8BE09_PYRGI|nr:uncharacterized protein PgNI_02672 [Pyricularia grisea]TLD14116.1 hypothetical protein PgNI_02672 [Pyricularia grisea]